jgi:hypothetical protein|tara:strand:- start:1594 stop:1905 length:312 start_codon:yes stop_codon:yes gene_type:complete
MVMENKIYVPKTSAKKVEFSNGGSLLRLGFHAETLIAWLQEQAETGEHVNARGYLSLVVSERRQPSEYGDTHSVSLDTWKPKTDPQPGTAGPSRPLKIEDIPF